MEELRLFLGGIKTVGSSPYALVSYLALLTAWTAVALRVRRNHQLLNNLEKLPEKDRITALRLEMGSAFLDRGMSPRDYITFQTRRYVFGGVCLIVLVAAGLVAASIFWVDRGALSVDVTPVVK